VAVITIKAEAGDNVNRLASISYDIVKNSTKDEVELIHNSHTYNFKPRYSINTYKELYPGLNININIYKR